jgi:hypothetical protein
LLGQTIVNYHRLLPGKHYGSISASRSFNDFLLSESVYVESSMTPPHAHEADSFNLLRTAERSRSLNLPATRPTHYPGEPLRQLFSLSD